MSNYLVFLTLLAVTSFAADTQVVDVTVDRTKQVGSIDGSRASEVSGMAFSRTYQRLYVHNDSGDTARFFFGNVDGSSLQEVPVDSVYPSDNEDMGLGPCPVGTCLFIGDVGDNAVNRTSTRLVIVKEEKIFGAKAVPYKILKMKYGDGKPHNCESLSVHPITGDVFLVTKTSGRAQVFKLSASDIASASNWATLTLKELGSIDLSLLFSGADPVVTGMAISPDGQKVALVTYTEVYEFHVDLAGRDVIDTSVLQGLSRVRHRFPRLNQQESVGYTSSGDLVITTEVGSSNPAPVIQLPTVKL